ncbi:VOC family protein [Evansella halocellulosilytica]|uniref:VOC family protein n=1 Tax=Evansella halocellulosilytica TaxID=2011013 RepID=UPI000BB7B56C|nr:VOC family protein [Evansella halocellulosilytica]
MKKELLYGVGIFVPVSDLKRSTNWYKEMLGFEIVHDDEPLANTLKICNGIVMICLVKSEDIVQPEFPKNDYDVGVYFNFHTTDADQAHEFLSQKGAKVSEIHDYDGIRGFDLVDPDGNRFGVVT